MTYLKLITLEFWGILVVPVQRSGLAPAGLLVRATGVPVPQEVKVPRTTTLCVAGSKRALVCATCISTWNVTSELAAEAATAVHRKSPAPRVSRRVCLFIL